MTAQILYIQQKNRNNPIKFANLEDFKYREGEHIDARTVINNPQLSLYCLDPQNQRAIFVETPADVDLSQFPFVYSAQYEYAQRLIAVSFSTLHQLAEEIKPTRQIILIYSVGRCGSTLLSKVFNQLESVFSLSEPDVFSQLFIMRNLDGSNDEEIAKLLKTCLIFISQQNLSDQYSHCVIKFRSHCIELGELIYNLFPNAKAIFLYRNAEDVVKSSTLAFPMLKDLLPVLEQIPDLFNLLNRLIPLMQLYSPFYVDLKQTDVIDIHTISWLNIMEYYLSLEEQKAFTCAVRYEDLVANQEPLVTSILQKCELPLADISKACKAFEVDFQIGSNISRDKINQNKNKPLDDENIKQKIKQILNNHPEIKTSDFRVPGTI